MAKRYRCLNPKCADVPGIPGHEFVSELPVCDRCGTDQTQPRLGKYVHTLKVIHYELPSGVDGEGLRKIACDPKRGVAGVRVTGDPSTVNCPLCRESQAFQDATKPSVLDEDDFPVSVNLGKGKVERAEEPPTLVHPEREDKNLSGKGVKKG